MHALFLGQQHTRSTKPDIASLKLLSMQMSGLLGAYRRLHWWCDALSVLHLVGGLLLHLLVYPGRS